MIRTSPPAPTAAYGDCTAFRLGLTESGLTWLSNLPEGTPLKTLVRLAKIRWRIEHDYRELKPGSAWITSKAAPTWAGTATSPSQPWPRRFAPATPAVKSGCAGLTLYAVLRELQTSFGDAPQCPTTELTKC
jgi:hypothetical protein